MAKENRSMSNVPNLRFPGFSGEWEVKKLGEIGDVKMCRRIFNEETSPIGEVPFFKIGSFGKEADAFIPNELYLNYRRKFSFPKKGDILISAAGTIGRTVVYKGEDAYYQDSNIVWIDNDNSNITNEFLFHILQIVKYNTEGGTIQRLYNNILKSTKFSSPLIPEQQKIASFLSLIYERIQTQNKIIGGLKTLKIATAKKIFSKELRFKDENGDDFAEWEEKRLGDVLSIQGGYAFKSNSFNQGTTKVIRIGDIYPTIKLANFSGVFSFETPNEKYIVKKNDFIMALSGATFGKVGKIFDDGIAYINQRVAVFRTEQSLEFYHQLVQTESFKNYINSIPTASAQPNISNDDIANYKSVLPSISEQTKIANFLSSIDEKIEVENLLLKQLESQKQYLLSNLFI